MTIKFKNNIGKKELISDLKNIFGTSTSNVSKITDDIIDTVILILKDKKKVNIKNFGSFNIVFKKEREGRNPKNQQKFNITSRNSISFKASSLLRDKLNEV